MNQPLVFICNSQYFAIPTSIGIYYLRKPKFQFKHISRFKIQSKKNPQVKEQHCLAEMFSRVSTRGLDILFLSNHNVHKSLCGLCFWASDPLIERDY